MNRANMTREQLETHAREQRDAFNEYTQAMHIRARARAELQAQIDRMDSELHELAAKRDTARARWLEAADELVRRHVSGEHAR